MLGEPPLVSKAFFGVATLLELQMTSLTRSLTDQPVRVPLVLQGTRQV
jgi:hypothetical protein